MKILRVHGIGHNDDNLGSWEDLWANVITRGLSAAAPAGAAPQFDALRYDPIFEPYLKNLGLAEFAETAWKLGSGAVTSRFRGLFDLTESQRWNQGMVVVFVNHDDLRAKLRAAFAAKLEEFQPDVIACHSLGTLLAYDSLTQDAASRQGRVLLTFATQLGNVFVRGGLFGGRISPLGDMPWFNLWNENDKVFAATSLLEFVEFQTAANFQQISTPFTDGASNHHAVDAVRPDDDDAYLSHPQTRAVLWPQLGGRFVTRSLAATATVAERVAPVKEAPVSPRKRALLVGINEYARTDIPKLEGCVNDVFLISSVLQESGFEADDIRVVLDDRATIAGIQERLHWLLDDVRADDQRFFYFSGHGALLPIYGPQGEIDRSCPCLVPHDFDWSKDTAVTDDTLLNFYSQLPYDSRLMMVFDCCHAGGLTRGLRQPRGLTPPDDIRHRLLQWDPKLQMWEQRELAALNKDLPKAYVGPSGADLRLGRAVNLRTLPNKKFDKVRKDLKHEGPYFPIVMEACGAEELAYEYQHGVIGYGAFTYAIAAVLRRSKGEVSYADLVKEATKVLAKLGYDQHPVVVGPKDILKKTPPWHDGAA